MSMVALSGSCSSSLLLPSSLMGRKAQVIRQETSKIGQKSYTSTAELHVAEAAVFATALVSDAERRGCLDPYQAVAGSFAGCPRSKIYSLHRRPKTLKGIASHIREELAKRYAALCEKQRKAYEHERDIATKIGASRVAIRAADLVAGRSSEAEEGFRQ